jgi:hypothetical protein
VAFDLHNVAELTAFNRLFRRQEAAVKATILVRRDGQPFAFRQREQRFRFGKVGVNGFSTSTFLPASSARFA